MISRCTRTLLTGLVDYAGLFPPARLPMQGACEEYLRHSMSEFEWALGRFVCPAARLAELEKHGAALMPGTAATSGYRERATGEPWRIAALIDAPDIAALRDTLDAIDAFNAAHAREENGLAAVDMIELKAPAPGFIDRALDEIPEDLFAFFEFPIAGDCRGFVAALAGNGAGAKVRTGGLTPDAIPSTRDLAAFLHACARAEVPFKATAGLHHPVRSELPLDSAPDAPVGLMHGFLNLFVAAALVKVRGLSEDLTRDALDERVEGSFRFSESQAGWHEHSVDAAELARVRESFALSFGSCSFDEPLADLREMGLL